MKNSLVNDFRYVLFSGKIILLIVVMTIVFSGSFIFNYSNLDRVKFVFEKQLEFDMENGIDVEAELLEEYSAITDAEGNTFVSNLIRYYKEMLEKKYSSCLVSYLFTNCLEISIMMFPIVISVFSATMAVAPINSKTYRTRVIREGRKMINISQHIVGIACMIIAVIVSMILSLPTSIIIEKKAKMLMNDSTIQMDVIAFNSIGNICARILLILLFGVVIFEVAYDISFIAKNSLVPIIFLIVFWFVVPGIGKYDPRDILTIPFIHFSPFWGAVSVNNVVDFSPLNGVLVSLAIICCFFYITNIIRIRRSAY